MKYFKFNLSELGFFAFALFFSFDAFFYPFSVLIDVNIPVGFFGVVLGFLLFLFLLKSCFLRKVKFPAFISLIPIVFFLIYQSDFSVKSDYYIWLRVLSIFSVGYFFSLWVFRGGLELNSSVFIFLFYLIFCFLCLVLSKVEGFNYLRVSDAFALTSILIAVMFKDSYLKNLLIFLIGGVVLYYIGSRGGLALFFISFVFMAFRANSYSKYYLVFSFSFFIFIGYLYFFYKYTSISDINNNRFLRIVFETQNDTSLIAREALQEHAIDVIKGNFYLGKYAYYRDFGQDGSYAHNFLSFIAELGVVGLLLFFFLSWPQLMVIRHSIFSSRKNLNVIAISTICFYSMVGIFFAKSYVWPVFYFAAGAGFFVSSRIRGNLYE